MTHAIATTEPPADGNLTFAGERPASVPARVAWTFFEFAGGPYFVVLQIFVFAAYFAGTIVSDPVTGQAYWGYTGGLAGLLVAFFSPVTGAIADKFGPRKPGVLLLAAELQREIQLVEASHGGAILAGARPRGTKRTHIAGRPRRVAQQAADFVRL